MTDPGYKLRFWGVRGTVPTPAREMLSFGGNTVCLAAALGEQEFLVLDCGSGLRLLGNHIASLPQGIPRRYHIFLSHYHFDHIEGLPFFPPLYDAHSAFTFHGFKSDGRSTREILEGLISPPYFPVRLAGVPARVEYIDTDGFPIKVRDVQVSCLPLRHPDGSLSYRLEHANRRVVFATDHEHGDEATDKALVKFSEGADYLIYDATYLQGEYESLRRGWGHSTWYAAVRTARLAGVKNLVLFHHHPDHTDSDLEEVLRVAREELPSTEIAREGMELPF
ncbi:MAG TPA: MBL fold metallo-hydrolase [Candidatus Polarisedimenticolia bacterium]|nr:MBL fold metallo-hydrolase [Candidatus Polarisedimenticolia bacterium]